MRLRGVKVNRGEKQESVLKSEATDSIGALMSLCRPQSG